MAGKPTGPFTVAVMSTVTQIDAEFGALEELNGSFGALKSPNDPFSA